MEHIKLATPEEVEKIKAVADITRATSIFSLRDSFAVLRPCTELDPVIFRENASRSEKQAFAFGLFSGLAMYGLSEVYFNVHADNEDFIKVLETAGCEKTSTAPEFRYKKAL